MGHRGSSTTVPRREATRDLQIAMWIVGFFNNVTTPNPSLKRFSKEPLVQVRADATCRSMILRFVFTLAQAAPYAWRMGLQSGRAGPQQAAPGKGPPLSLLFSSESRR